MYSGLDNCLRSFKNVCFWEFCTGIWCRLIGTGSHRMGAVGYMVRVLGLGQFPFPRNGGSRLKHTLEEGDVSWFQEENGWFDWAPEKSWVWGSLEAEQYRYRKQH